YGLQKAEAGEKF
ncbi:hypothetical protein CMUS01_12377, partial [Colletotrichum musicola]